MVMFLSLRHPLSIGLPWLWLFATVLAQQNEQCSVQCTPVESQLPLSVRRLPVAEGCGYYLSGLIKRACYRCWISPTSSVPIPCGCAKQWLDVTADKLRYGQHELRVSEGWLQRAPSGSAQPFAQACFNGPMWLNSPQWHMAESGSMQWPHAFQLCHVLMTGQPDFSRLVRVGM